MTSTRQDKRTTRGGDPFLDHLRTLLGEPPASRDAIVTHIVQHQNDTALFKAALRAVIERGKHPLFSASLVEGIEISTTSRETDDFFLQYVYPPSYGLAISFACLRKCSGSDNPKVQSAASKVCFIHRPVRVYVW